MMKIVIDISEEVFDEIYNKNYYSLKGKETLRLAVRDSTPLPKGHGKLIDFEKLCADISEKEELARQRVMDTPTSSPCYMRYIAQLNERTAFKEMLYDAPTIIEADKEGEQE